ncbi:general substrate transporter [Cylindrobasidium torrendii FP15055 ss-10]|uniref:General substrate transporter n=1 Tax=Cylindrobasidium torrendii FP15055 ss-10 TaxID=1314674 RepID=A0A0D7BGE5_9AGAR|nr:general substrate transporter [Cylindrobasidium torrendii FP15055 ss-10]
MKDTATHIEVGAPAAQARLTWYTFNCALFAAIGSLLYGIDSGIISTTISHDTFKEYFAPYTDDISGAVVSTFGAGSFFGVICAGWTADRFGRKRTIQVAALIALVSGAIQAGSVHVGMLIAGRIVGGFAVGMMNMVIPIYNSEIAPPRWRGLVSGLHAQFVGFGFAAANWIGYGCSFSTGQFQWRFPLAVQCIPAIVLLAGIAFLPFSPRWLLENGRSEEAFEVYKKLNEADGTTEEAAQLAKFTEMRIQMEEYNKNVVPSYKTLFSTPAYRKRLMLACLVQAFTQLSGINVINYYQTTLYQGVGITGHNITLLAGIYGLVGPIANMVCLAYIDRWGRKPTMWITGIVMSCNMAILMALTSQYTGTTNTTGQGATIAFIFTFSIVYSLGYNSVHYIYVPEILSQAMRARGSVVSVCCNIVINIILNQISPRAFASVGYKYYALFLSTNIVGAAVVYMVFVETKGRTLEEIGELFGEKPKSTDDDLKQSGTHAQAPATGDNSSSMQS